MPHLLNLSYILLHQFGYLKIKTIINDTSKII